MGAEEHARLAVAREAERARKREEKMQKWECDRMKREEIRRRREDKRQRWEEHRMTREEERQRMTAEQAEAMRAAAVQKAAAKKQKALEMAEHEEKRRRY